MPVPTPTIALLNTYTTVPVLAYYAYYSLFPAAGEKPSITLGTKDPRIFVIHDGRKQEGFPILSRLPFLSIMEGASKKVKRDHPNTWRKTDYRDDDILDTRASQIAKNEPFYSEFSPLYVIWQAGMEESGFIGKMHYRSYLNLSDRNKVVKVNKEEDSFNGLEETAYFEGAHDRDYVEQMGYGIDNIKAIMNGESSEDKGGSGYDILTSTPLDFNKKTIAGQFIYCHSGNNPDMKEVLVKLLVKSGELIYKYNRSANRIDDGFVISNNNDNDDKDNAFSKILHEYGIKEKTSGSKILLAFSKSWNEHIGLQDYLLKNTPAKVVPYMKDLFIMRDIVFLKYMTFIYYMLDNIQKECSDEIEKYKKDGPDGGKRIFAFLGERLTSYFIHFMLTQMNLSVGVVPRAHYGDAKNLSDFIGALYKPTENHVPLFKFRKYAGKSDDNKPAFKMMYLTTDGGAEAINDACNNGYTFEACIGYLRRVDPTDYSGMQVFCAIKGNDETEYRIIDNSERKSRGESCILLGAEVIDKEHVPISISEVADVTAKNQVYGVNGTGQKSIKVATFGRPDIIG